MEKEREIEEVLDGAIEKEGEKISALEKVKEGHVNHEHELEDEKKYLEEKIAAGGDDVEEVESMQPVKSMKEVKSIDEIKNIQEVKSIKPVKSIQEVKKIYELTDEQDAELRQLVKGYGKEAKYGKGESKYDDYAADYVVAASHGDRKK